MGQGVAVAVVDSGLSPSQDFIGGVVNGTRFLRSATFNKDSSTNADVYGHGTHVAGIIGGDGSSSGGTYSGAAPGVDIINLKICDENGNASESDAVAALQWVYENRVRYGIRVVNLSVNAGGESSYHFSPLDAACEILWFDGIVVVASSGNRAEGEPARTVRAAPANDPFVITVGATEENGTADPSDDRVAGFSASGATVDGVQKPDIVAPGKDIVSVLAKRSLWDVEHPERKVGDSYFRLSGTSMSAPMVSAVAALMLQKEPGLDPDQVKYRLTHTARTVVAADGRAIPYLDAYAAVTSTSTRTANTGLPTSRLLSTGTEPIAGSVMWNSVMWNSVMWNSVMWNSVMWNSVMWN